MNVSITTHKAEYYPGDFLSGKVKITPNSKISISGIEMTLYMIEDWNHLRSDKRYESSNNTQNISVFYVKVNLFLNKPQNTSIELEPKEYEFPFEEKLPEYLLPSFEFPQNEFRAFLRYSLTAKVLSKKPISNSIFINIKAIPKNDNMDLNIKASLNAKKWGLFDKGETTLSASFPTKNYKLTDKIPIDVEIDNTKSKMKVIECKLKLIRKIIFRSKEDFTDKYFKEDNLIKIKNKINVDKKEKKYFNYNLDLSSISFKDFNYDGFSDPYKGTKNIKDLIPSLYGNILSCRYTVIVMLKFDTHIKKEERPKSILPIYIVHKLDDDHIIKAQKEIDRMKIKEEEKNRENLNLNNYGGFEIIKNDENKNIINSNSNNCINNNNININKKEDNIIIEKEENNNFYNNLNNQNNDKQNDDDYIEYDDLPSRETLLRLDQESKNKNIINDLNNNINNDFNNGNNNNININLNNNLNNNNNNKNNIINNYLFNENKEMINNNINEINGQNYINDDTMNYPTFDEININNNLNNNKAYNNNIDNNNFSNKNDKKDDKIYTNSGNNNIFYINNKENGNSNIQNMENNFDIYNNDNDEKVRESNFNLFDDDDENEEENNNKNNNNKEQNKVYDINAID